MNKENVRNMRISPNNVSTVIKFEKKMTNTKIHMKMYQTSKTCEKHQEEGPGHIKRKDQACAA